MILPISVDIETFHYGAVTLETTSAMPAYPFALLHFLFRCALLREIRDSSATDMQILFQTFAMKPQKNTLLIL